MEGLNDLAISIQIESEHIYSQETQMGRTLVTAIPASKLHGPIYQQRLLHLHFRLVRFVLLLTTTQDDERTRSRRCCTESIDEGLEFGCGRHGHRRHRILASTMLDEGQSERWKWRNIQR